MWIPSLRIGRKTVASKDPTKLSRHKKTSPESTASKLIKAASQYQSTIELSEEISEILPLENSSTGISIQDILQAELHTARLLNVDIPDDPKQFIRILESRIQEITGTRKNVILILDEESGTYTCLNDELSDDFAKAPRELTWISDTYLQDMLDSPQVIHSFLHHQGNIFGIIAIADKEDGSPFTLRDDIVLEQLTQYLSVQVSHYLTLKQSLAKPAIQRILLQVSNRLLCAIDSPAIFQSTMETICEEIPFTAAQFIQLDRETGRGMVLYELANGMFTQDTVIREVDQFVSLLSLFQSQVWKHSYLYLKGEMLGDKSFSELFGLPDIKSVLMLPMVSQNNNINGALVLFQQETPVSLSKEALQAVEQISELLVSACERAHVLEKALEIATTDELTGALNRRGFYNRFDAEIDRARRNATPMCMAMIDIDHFKCINDTYGHLAGDQILSQLINKIQQNVRKSDILCRYGGEEFALVLPETTLPAAVELLERLRRKAEKCAFQTAAGPVKITFSMGVTTVETTKNFTKDFMHVVSESIAKADEALYEAKQLGRNRIIATDA